MWLKLSSSFESRKIGRGHDRLTAETRPLRARLAYCTKAAAELSHKKHLGVDGRGKDSYSNCKECC
jgi:hypothetical protein